MQINEKYKNVDGSFFFSLRDLLNDRQGCATALKSYYAEKDADTPAVSVPDKQEPSQTNAGKKTAYAGRANLQIDGKTVEMEVYTIDDYSYFKLRDIAKADCNR